MPSMREKNILRAEARAAESFVISGSRIARAGLGLVQMAAMIRLVQPLLIFCAAALMMLVACVYPAAAQQTGGSLLSGNSQNPISGFRTLLNIAVWALVGIGIGGIGWGIANGMRERAWGAQVFWGGSALGFGGIVALINAVVNDDPVDLPDF